jgi:hypothetical protein
LVKKSTCSKETKVLCELKGCQCIKKCQNLTLRKIV